MNGVSEEEERLVRGWEREGEKEKEREKGEKKKKKSGDSTNHRQIFKKTKKNNYK